MNSIELPEIIERTKWARTHYIFTLFHPFLKNCNFFRFYLCRATTEECPVAIIVMSTQSIMGVIIQACMAGIIFAKFTVPRKRGQTLVFSKNAVITQRNGALYLICRVCDLRKSSLLEAHVRMVIIKKEVTDEGETIPYQLSDLDVTTEVKYTSISSLDREPIGSEYRHSFQSNQIISGLRIRIRFIFVEDSTKSNF